MTDQTIKIVLTADGRQYSATLNKATGQLDQLGDRSERTARRMGFLRTEVASLRSAVAALGIGIAAKQILDAGLQSERFANALRAATGSSARAAQELSFVRQEAERIGIDFQSAAGAYAKLAAAARGTALEGEGAREVFTAVAEASRVMGLSGAEAEGTLRAIEQIISKGTLSAEELRQQLGDRLPGAFQIAARSMGVTTAQLSKMIEQGEVLADDFLPRFARELRRSVSGGFEDASQGPAAQIERLGNAMFELKDAIATSGVLTALGNFAEGLSEIIRANVFFFENQGLLEMDPNTMNRAQKQVRRELLAERLRDLEAQRAQLAQSPRARLAREAAALSEEERIRRFGPGGIPRDPTEGLTQRIEDVRADIEKLDRLLKAEEEASKRAFGRGDGDGEGSGGGGGRPRGRSPFERRAEQLRAAIALEGELTEAGRVRAELEAGLLGQVSQAQARKLVALAEERDAQVALIEEEERLQEHMQRRLELEEERREAAQQSLAGLVQSLESETEAELRRQREGQAILDAALAERLISLQKHHQLTEALERDHQARLLELHERQARRIEREGSEAFRELSRAVKGWGRDFADTLLDNERNFGGFVDSMFRELQRIAIARATEPLFGAFEEILGGVIEQLGGGGDGAAAGRSAAARPAIEAGTGRRARPALPGAAMGGTFEVGGPPGIDRSLVAFRATRGERVTVTRPGQDAGDATPVRIELVNRGTPKEAQVGDVRFDPRGMVVQVLVDDLQRGGAITGAMARSFGLRRSSGG